VGRGKLLLPSAWRVRQASRRLRVFAGWDVDDVLPKRPAAARGVRGGDRGTDAGAGAQQPRQALQNQNDGGERLRMAHAPLPPDLTLLSAHARAAVPSSRLAPDGRRGSQLHYKVNYCVFIDN